MTALEAHISSLEMVLTAMGKREEIIPALRKLRDIVAVPRLAMRLTALASERLFGLGKPEEAILELDILGGVEAMEDSRALLLAARHFDLTDKERRTVLQKAISRASCDEERQLARLNLAACLIDVKNFKEALSQLHEIIESTRNDSSSDERSAALILRWTITQSDEDFEVAHREMKIGDPRSHKLRNGIFLVDSGKHSEAEDLLAELIKLDDVQAKLIIVDSRIRTGKKDAALELFNSIRQDEVAADDRLPYAHALGLLVLAAGFSTLRDAAISAFKYLPTTGGTRSKIATEMLALLERMDARR